MTFLGLDASEPPFFLASQKRDRCVSAQRSPTIGRNRGPTS